MSDLLLLPAVCWELPTAHFKKTRSSTEEWDFVRGVSPGPKGYAVRPHLLGAPNGCCFQGAAARKFLNRGDLS
jgi:hypothetical protein